MDDKEDEEGSEGEKDGVDGGNQPVVDGFTKQWGWVDNVVSVAAITKEKWSDVWKMSILEFLNLLCYIKDKNAHDKQMIEKWKREH